VLRQGCFNSLELTLKNPNDGGHTFAHGLMTDSKSLPLRRQQCDELASAGNEGLELLLQWRREVFTILSLWVRCARTLASCARARASIRSVFARFSRCLREVAGLPRIHDSNCIAGALQRATNRHLIASGDLQYHKISLAFCKGGEQLFVACRRVGIVATIPAFPNAMSRVAFATSIPTAIFSDMVPRIPFL
jgi:hypothetical protein